jgi:NitT/TauT family transport system permease protein
MGGIMKDLKKSLQNILPPLMVLVVLVIGWAVAIAIFDPPPFVLPGPTRTIRAAISNIDRLKIGLRNTFIESVVGISAAIILGVVGSIVMSFSKHIERALFPWAVVLQTTPSVAIAPLIVLWFSPKITNIILITFIIALFPILANTLMGLVSTDPALIDLLRMQGASNLQIFWKIKIPSALPYFFTGLRISAGLGVIGAIVGEMTVGRGGEEAGLGYYVMFSSTQLKTDFLFSTILLSTALGVSFFFVAYILSWLALRKWHESALAKAE